jgi:hypothetical protein
MQSIPKRWRVMYGSRTERKPTDFTLRQVKLITRNLKINMLARSHRQDKRIDGTEQQQNDH